jgi:hypothetical protein
MIKFLHLTFIYYKKNKKSRNAVFSLTILFLLIANLFFQIYKSAQYYIKFELSNSTYQVNNRAEQVLFLKKFVLYSGAKNLEKEKILFDLNADNSIVIDEKSFFKIVDHDFNQETKNLNNTELHKYFEKKLTNKFNLFISDEIIIALNKEEEIVKKITSKLFNENPAIDSNLNEFAFNLSRVVDLYSIANNNDIVSIKIKKEFKNTFSSNQIVLLNFFILCLPLFYPNLLITFRKL